MAGLKQGEKQRVRAHPSGIGMLVDCEGCGRTYVVIGPRYTCSRSRTVYATPTLA